MSNIRTTLLLTFLSAALSHPLDPRSPDPPVPVIIGPPDSQIFACTATLEVPPQPCATEQPHAYAATETLHSEVNCAGCLAVSLRTIPNGACPSPTAPLETVSGTTTEWEAICSPTPTLPLIHPRDGLHPRQDAPIARPSCPTTIILPVESTGATATVFEQYVTVTSSVPCGGCDLITSTMVGGLGFIRSGGITATAEVGTSTVYACEG